LNKAPDAFRTISEVADELDLPQHVLRFWESRFPHIKPMKRGGGRRYYRPEDIDLLRGIRRLLYGDGYTIRGVQRILREQGVRTVQSVGQGHAANLPPPFPPPLAGEGRVGADDAHDAEDEPNGAPAALTFSSPMDSETSEEAEDETEEQESDELAPESAPQNGPISGASSVAVAPARRAETPPVRQASAHVAAPSPKGIAAEDLDRLKQALAELEACRRLLDKANEGGR
jgi:DNA-binding transcriptional MerR regulator